MREDQERLAKEIQEQLEATDDKVLLRFIEGYKQTVPKTVRISLDAARALEIAQEKLQEAFPSQSDLLRFFIGVGLHSIVNQIKHTKKDEDMPFLDSVVRTERAVNRRLAFLDHRYRQIKLIEDISSTLKTMIDEGDIAEAADEFLDILQQAQKEQDPYWRKRFVKLITDNPFLADIMTIFNKTLPEKAESIREVLESIA
jgi:hypothetical protein